MQLADQEKAIKTAHRAGSFETLASLPSESALLLLHEKSVLQIAFGSFISLWVPRVGNWAHLDVTVSLVGFCLMGCLMFRLEVFIVFYIIPLRSVLQTGRFSARLKLYLLKESASQYTVFSSISWKLMLWMKGILWDGRHVRFRQILHWCKFIFSIIWSCRMRTKFLYRYCDRFWRVRNLAKVTKLIYYEQHHLETISRTRTVGKEDRSLLMSLATTPKENLDPHGGINIEINTSVKKQPVA